MIQPSSGKTELDNPDRLNRLLENELEQKRAEWMHCRERYRTIRVLSFLFLFLIIAGSLLAFFFVFTQLQR